MLNNPSIYFIRLWRMKSSISNYHSLKFGYQVYKRRKNMRVRNN